MTEHNKLVRDKIPEICEASGATPHTRVIEDDQEYLEALFDKLDEEVAELKRDRNLGEAADVTEVVRAIVAALGHTPEQLEQTRAQKAEERGGFGGRIFLISTDEVET